MTVYHTGDFADYTINMSVNFAKGVNYEQPMFITMIESGEKRTEPVLINRNGDFNMNKSKIRTTKIS